MEFVQALFMIGGLVLLVIIALLVNSLDAQKREEREAAANRHRELMRCFHTIERRASRRDWSV